MTAEKAYKRPKKQSLSKYQRGCLDYIRAHPGCPTSDLVIDQQRYIPPLLKTLQTLIKRGLIGRQPAVLDGEYESHWWPEVVEEEGAMH